MFQTTFQSRITTPIPPDVEPKSLVSLLHEHSTVITLQPIVTRHEVAKQDPETGWIVYDVYEKIAILPFKLWEKEIVFQTSFRDKEDGVTSFLDTGAAVKSEADYTVRLSEQVEGEGTGWVLDEQIESSCNFLLKWFVQSTMIPVRKKLHEQIIDKLRERQNDSSKGA